MENLIAEAKSVADKARSFVDSFSGIAETIDPKAASLIAEAKSLVDKFDVIVDSL